MKKIMVILFLVSALGLQAQGLDTYSFQNLIGMSFQEQTAFMQGFILGLYSAAAWANHQGLLSKDEALSLMILDLGAQDLLFQTLDWYEETRSLKTPLYFAIYGRLFR